jgi:quercetin dioxygenase-like cupin family protein
MHIFDFEAIGTTPILEYQSTGATSASIANGGGEAHVHWLRFEPGGQISPHPTGFAQLFIPLDGCGWVAGPDGRRQIVKRGQAALFSRGETHSKGSDSGMSALMVQVFDLKDELL